VRDYNDGKWHGWNGGECPVHPETVIEVIYAAASDKTAIKEEALAKYCEWGNECDTPIIAFRVITPYVEPPKPREFWVNDYGDGDFAAHETKELADESAASTRIACIHVREVLE